MIKRVQLSPCLALRHKDCSLTVQPDCGKVWVVCGTVYGDVNYKDLLGSIARVVYCIPVLNFYLVLYTEKAL